MASQIGICNEALDLLPAARIQSIDAATPEAKNCKAQYALAKRHVLSRRSWTFLRNRVALAPVDVAAVIRQHWAYGYARPIEMQIEAVLPDVAAMGAGTTQQWRAGVPFEIVGDVILTDAAGAAGVVRISPDDCAESRIDALTATAIAHELARRVCLPITKSNTRYRELAQEAVMALELAAQMDQAQTPQTYGEFVPEALVARHA